MKKNNRGFLLAESLIVSTFVLTILIFDAGYIYAPFVAVGCYYLFYYLNIKPVL